MSARDLELLSAYIDGELSDKEKLEIEQKIKLSPQLQQELLKLQKLKNLTFASAKKLPESPYFEARLMAALNSDQSSGSKLKRWFPAIGFGLLTLFLMVFLKYHPEAINDLVKQQQTNLAGFYKENLKPLLFAADLSNEDIFNFAFYHRLPLDKNNNKILQLSYSNAGDQFFEIKNSDMRDIPGNYGKFVSALNLSDKEKDQMDSILGSYKDELEMQVLANEKNTIAINPNLWNYNKAIAADLISFAKHTSKSELAKIIPVDLPLYVQNNIKDIVREVKATQPNEFIFLTPDTIFSEHYAIDSHKINDEVKQMRRDLKTADRDWRKNFAVAINLDRNISRLHSDTSWNKNFKVNFDSNACRVYIARVEIPEIQLPDFDQLAGNIEEAVRHVQAFTVNFPKIPIMGGEFNIRVGADSSNGYNFNFRMPNLDSITHFVPTQVDSLIRLYNKNFNFNKSYSLNLDSLVSGFNYNVSDSLYYLQNKEFREQIKEFQKEMKKFKEEMQRLKMDMRKDSTKSGGTKKFIEI